MGVAYSAARGAYHTCICYKPPRVPPARPASAKSTLSAEDEAISVSIAEYENLQRIRVPPRPDPYTLRKEALRQDAIRRIRKSLVRSVSNKQDRARYMERYFAMRNGDGAGDRDGVNSKFINPDAPTSPGAQLGNRIVSLDHVPLGMLDSWDPLDVGNGRLEKTPTRKGLVPGFGDGTRDWADATSDSEDEFAEHDFAAAAEKTTPRVEPPSPKTLARIRLDIDGTPLSYPEGRGLTRWRAYCVEEEEKIGHLAVFFLAERELKDEMMRAHYRETLGAGGEDKYVPPPLPTWLTKPDDPEWTKKHAPWRVDRFRKTETADDFDGDDERDGTRSANAKNKNKLRRKALGAMHKGLRDKVLSWRASVELRQTVVDRRIRTIEACDKMWGDGNGRSIVDARDGLTRGGDEIVDDNPVRMLDNYPSPNHIANSPAYHTALKKGGLEPSRVVATALRDVRDLNYRNRETRLARDAARAKIRRRDDRYAEKVFLKKQAKAESVALRKAVAAADAKPLALENAPPRWARAKAIGRFIRTKTGSKKRDEA